MMKKEQDPNSDSSARRSKGAALGAGAGIIVGAALGNPGVGMVLGGALGLILGPALLRKYK